MDALVGTGPMSSDTLLDWIEEINRILVRQALFFLSHVALALTLWGCVQERDEGAIFAEPVDKQLYPEYYQVHVPTLRYFCADLNCGVCR